MSEQQVEALKAKGNAAFASGKYTESIQYFTEAIEVDPSNHLLYSNRSASYASIREYEAALNDSKKALELKPAWTKGWSRKGIALLGLGRLEEAKEAYKKGLEIEAGNEQLLKGLEMVEAKLRNSSSPAFGQSTGNANAGDASKFRSSPSAENPFSDPLVWDKLKSDPKMQAHLSDPDFIRIIEEIKKDPKSLQGHIKDPRVMQAFAIMLGVQIKDPSSYSSSPSMPFTNETFSSKSTNEQRSPPPTTTTTTTTNATETETEIPVKSVEVQKEKELGNAAYKVKNFEKAIEHYDAALSIDPQNIAILNNKAAVYFETERYDECIAQCEEAIAKGREIYADFKLMAKAFGRIGSAYERKGDLQNAIVYYQKSLTEHRTPETLEKQRQAEKTLEEAKKEAYRDPKIAVEERNIGNEFFKKGQFDEAIKHYNEAIKRDDSDVKNWSNRAACYLKLAAVPEGLKDCDRAIAIDPTFVKAYIRRAGLLFLRRDYSESLVALDKATSIDVEGKNSVEIQSMRNKTYGEIRRQQGAASNSSETDEEKLARVAQNPEIRELLSDPVMIQILKDMQHDPRAISEHMKNPVVAEKIRKLVAAGIIRTG